MAKIYDAVLRLKDEFSKNLLVAEKHLENFNSNYRRVGRDVNKVGKSIGKVGSTLTKGLTVPLMGMGVASGKAFIDFEDAMAGVRKTTDLTDQEFDVMKKSLRDMSKEIPVTVEELAALTEAAGQLGIKKENLVDFTRVMADLKVATNLGDEGASDLAKFANITGMDQGNFDRLGSTIVDLGNNFATTEQDIVNMSMRIAGAGRQLGLSEAEIMGFATALSSVGLEAQLGGTNFSKLVTNMQLASETGDKGMMFLNETLQEAGISIAQLENGVRLGGKTMKSLETQTGMTSRELREMYKEAMEGMGSMEDFANVMGITTVEFQNMMKNNPAEAVSKFLQELGNTEKQGKSTIAILEEMDIKNAGLRDMLLRASGAGEVLTDALETGTKAWNENTALTVEAETKYKTLASQLKITWNNVKDLAITVGEYLAPYVEKASNFIKDLTMKFNALDEGTKQNIVRLAAMAMAFGPTLLGVSKVTKGIGGGLIAFGKLGKAITGAGGIMKWIATGPTGLIVAVIVAVIGIVIALIANWDKVKAKAEEVFPGITATISGAIDMIIQIFEWMWVVIEPILNLLHGVFTMVWNAILEVIIYVATGIQNKIDFVVGIFNGVIEFLTGVFTLDWEKAWGGVVSIFGTVFGGIVDFIKRPLNLGIGLINAFIRGLNKIKFPDWVPGIGGKGITIPEIPKLAKGTNNWGGGIVQVHERGGEIIDLPRGSRVMPHDKSVIESYLMGRNEPKPAPVNVFKIPKLADQVIFRDELDMDIFLEKLFKRFKDAKDNMIGAEA